MPYWKSETAIGYGNVPQPNATIISEEEYNTLMEEIKAKAEQNYRAYEEWLKEHTEGSEEND